MVCLWKRKKLIEIKGKVTTLQKVCLALQVIVIVAMLVSMIYANVNDIESGFMSKVLYLSVFLVFVFMWIPIVFSGDKGDK